MECLTGGRATSPNSLNHTCGDKNLLIKTNRCEIIRIFKVYCFSKCISTTGKYFKFRILENLQQLLSTFSDCVIIQIRIVILLFHIKLLINDQLLKKMVINCQQLLNMDYHV